MILSRPIFVTCHYVSLQPWTCRFTFSARTRLFMLKNVRSMSSLGSVPFPQASVMRARCHAAPARSYGKMSTNDPERGHLLISDFRYRKSLNSFKLTYERYLRVRQNKFGDLDPGRQLQILDLLVDDTMDPEEIAAKLIESEAFEPREEELVSKWLTFVYGKEEAYIKARLPQIERENLNDDLSDDSPEGSESGVDDNVKNALQAKRYVSNSKSVLLESTANVEMAMKLLVNEAVSHANTQTSPNRNSVVDDPENRLVAAFQTKSQEESKEVEQEFKGITVAMDVEYATFVQGGERLPALIQIAYKNRVWLIWLDKLSKSKNRSHPYRQIGGSNPPQALLEVMQNPLIRKIGPGLKADAQALASFWACSDRLDWEGFRNIVDFNQLAACVTSVASVREEFELSVREELGRMLKLNGLRFYGLLFLDKLLTKKKTSANRAKKSHWRAENLSHDMKMYAKEDVAIVLDIYDALLQKLGPCALDDMMEFRHILPDGTDTISKPSKMKAPDREQPDNQHAQQLLHQFTTETLRERLRTEYSTHRKAEEQGVRLYMLLEKHAGMDLVQLLELDAFPTPNDMMEVEWGFFRFVANHEGLDPIEAGTDFTVSPESSEETESSEPTGPNEPTT